MKVVGRAVRTAADRPMHAGRRVICDPAGRSVSWPWLPLGAANAADRTARTVVELPAQRVLVCAAPGLSISCPWLPLGALAPTATGATASARAAARGVMRCAFMLMSSPVAVPASGSNLGPAKRSRRVGAHDASVFIITLPECRVTPDETPPEQARIMRALVVEAAGEDAFGLRRWSGGRRAVSCPALAHVSQATPSPSRSSRPLLAA